MLDSPMDYAQSIISERMPVPRFVSADYGSGQERLIKSVLDPSLEGTQNFKEGYFFCIQGNLWINLILNGCIL